jgi:CheY-like chemotaxis protein
MNNGPVFIVDDDEDDQEIVKEVWNELGYTNELRFFRNGEEVLNHLKTNPTVPFLIICEVNIPKMDGLELKKRVLEEDSVYYKSVPFVFWSTQASKEQIKRFYDLCGNGFFLKGNSIAEIKSSLAVIVEYWRRSLVP